jgi:protein involved in polysaccharide export with SLBB domain
VKKLCKSLECRRIIFAYTFVFASYLLCITGCGGLTLSSPKEVREFERAGPITPEVDIDSLLRAKVHTGPYRVVTSDVLELQMPTILRVISSDLSDSLQKVEPYLCRVSNAGTITLPIIGELPVVGKKLAEIEELVVDSYFPKYIVNRPSVVCKVTEYQTENVTVVGAVAEPGVYQLRGNEMSLVALLMKAGGIVEDGAGLITIQSPGRAGEDELPKTTGSPDLAALPHPVDVEKKEVDLVFRQNDSPSTKGRLTVSRRNNTLHSAEVDIAHEKDREVFVKNLAKLHQDTQSSDIERALVQLAENIEQSSNVEPYDNDSNDSEQKELINVAEPELSVPDIGPTKVAGLGYTNSRRIVLPVKGLNIPFADVALHDGDVVEVEKLDQEVFTVLGPVKSPGTFPYPPDAQYNLMQALAFAGGPDLVLDPRYVTIYRQDANGEIVSATFGLDKKFLANASNIKIKPGDVVSVEMTLATRARLILKEMFYFRMGYDLDELIRPR